MHSGKSSTGTDTRPPIRKYLIGASVTSACMVPIALSMQHQSRGLAVLTALWVAQVASILAADYYEWHRNLERSKKIIRNSVNFLYYIEKSSTWDQTPSLVPAHILATWQILQLELDYMARRPRWNPFRTRGVPNR